MDYLTIFWYPFLNETTPIRQSNNPSVGHTLLSYNKFHFLVRKTTKDINNNKNNIHNYERRQKSGNLWTPAVIVKL